MRLICPNCGAQYEVDDAVIPDQGRDVQCSNCGHTWLQQPAHRDADLAEELGQDLPEFEDDAEDSVEPEAEDSPLPPEPKTDPKRRGLDPKVAGLLREEAEREAAARKSKTDTLETQTEMGLDDAEDTAAQRSAEARARVARLRSMDDTEAEAAVSGTAADGSSRRELLPDVEEINSSLRASNDRETEGSEGNDQGEGESRAKSGTRRLVSRVIVLTVVVGLMVYAFAPQIIKFAPQAEPVMVRYVEWANGLRDQINHLIAPVMDKIKSLIG